MNQHNDDVDLVFGLFTLALGFIVTWLSLTVMGCCGLDLGIGRPPRPANDPFIEPFPGDDVIEPRP